MGKGQDRNSIGYAFLQTKDGFARDFLQDFWYISRMTVPMMILAGFLGAVLAASGDDGLR